MITGLFEILGQVVHKMLGGLEALGEFLAPPPPEIPAYTRKKMIECGIGYKELMKAYHSPRTEPGRKPGSTCGVHFGKNLAVGAVYMRDEKNPKNYVIIGCWASPIGEYYRKFGNVRNQYLGKR